MKLRSLVTRSCCCCVCCSFFLFLRRLCCTRGRATAAVRRPLARSLRLFLPPSSPPSAGFFAVTVPGLRLSAASLAHRVERQPGKCVCAGVRGVLLFSFSPLLFLHFLAAVSFTSPHLDFLSLPSSPSITTFAPPSPPSITFERPIHQTFAPLIFILSHFPRFPFPSSHSSFPAAIAHLHHWVKHTHTFCNLEVITVRRLKLRGRGPDIKSTVWG